MLENLTEDLVDAVLEAIRSALAAEPPASPRGRAAKRPFVLALAPARPRGRRQPAQRAQRRASQSAAAQLDLFGALSDVDPEKIDPATLIDDPEAVLGPQ